LTYDRDFLWIPAKSGDVFLHPFQGSALVKKTAVGFEAVISQFLRRQEPRDSEAIAVSF
jgi:hypothetical protein